MKSSSSITVTDFIHVLNVNDTGIFVNLTALLFLYFIWRDISRVTIQFVWCQYLTLFIDCFIETIAKYHMNY
jgi:hypothetical protein